MHSLPSKGERERERRAQGLRLQFLQKTRPRLPCLAAFLSLRRRGKREERLGKVPQSRWTAPHTLTRTSCVPFSPACLPAHSAAAAAAKEGVRKRWKEREGKGREEISCLVAGGVSLLKKGDAGCGRRTGREEQERAGHQVEQRRKERTSDATTREPRLDSTGLPPGSWRRHHDGKGGAS